LGLFMQNAAIPHATAPAKCPTHGQGTGQSRGRGLSWRTMTTLKRILSVLVLSLGLLGFAGCVALGVGGLFGSAWLSRTTKNVFEKVDGVFVIIRDKVDETHARVDDARITAEGMEQSLKQWARDEARERLGSRLDVEEKADRAAQALAEADKWLELSAAATEMLQQVFALGASAGAAMDTRPADRLLEEIGSLRGQLDRAGETVEKIRSRAAGDEKMPRGRIEQAVQLALRLVATLGSIDERLAKLETRLSEIQEEVRGWEAATLRWIFFVTAAFLLLTAWMAAGQCALFLYGWRGVRGPA
jgi:flagellin-like hook-associated protein FlgL